MATTIRHGTRHNLVARTLRIAGESVPHIILTILCVAAIVPFLWMVMASLKNYKELVSTTTFFPQVWTLKNYEAILGRVAFPAGIRNSVIAAISVTVVTVFTSALCGYVFSKYHFKGKEALFTILLATMMVPFAVVLIPLYLTIGEMKLINNLAGVIVTGFWSTFGIFMLRQFMETVPNELLDAARIDGASEVRIFATIMLPLATAPMGALAIFAFLGNWDSYLWPLVVLSSPEKQTLPLLLSGMRNLYLTRYEMWCAGSMLTVIPIMIIYAFASRYFIRGIAMSGLKA